MASPDSSTRTVGEIVRANVLTRFNALLGSLLLVILVVGPLQDALFGIVLVANTVVGVVQEVRAKRTLDRLALLSAPTATVVRGEAVQTVALDEVVPGDLVRVRSGDQIVADGPVVEADGLEIDESLLSGEAEPQPRIAGDDVLSGSFVVAGTGTFRALHTGADAYAGRLAQEARRFSLVGSELRSGIDRILRWVTWAIVPTAVLLVSSQLAIAGDNLEDAVRASVAGIGAMVPEGLVLLTSIAFAVSILRLGRRQVLVQELAAVEGLARVDVVCVDKTGTLTTADLRLSSIEPLGAHTDAEARGALGAVVAADAAPNVSMRAIGAAVPPTAGEVVVPFSSSRRFSASSDAQGSVWVLGAPDVLLAAGDPVLATCAAHAASGERVLLLGRGGALATTDDGPPDIDPVAVLALAEQIREDAAETVAFFREQGVTVKVLSGDDPATVGHIATAVGIAGGDQPLDGRELPEDVDALAAAMDRTSVVGRVDPHRKRDIVRALQHAGHVVAMTGDGVNDVLALKEADLGVAMGSGSAASRAVARLVLLDSSWAALPAVVAEGRRVIANVERVANLFVTKTVYAFLLAVAVAVARLPFPFLPRQLTIVSSLTIGIPAFFLALAPNDVRARRGFAWRVLRFALPAGAVAAVATFGGYGLARSEHGVSLDEARTVATVVLFAVAAWVLAILARPLNFWRGALVAASVAGFLLVASIGPTRDLFALDLPSVVVLFAAIGIAAIACGVLEAGWQLSGWVAAHGNELRRVVRVPRGG